MKNIRNKATSDNSEHTATLRYAQIRHSRTSHVRKPLGDIAIVVVGA